jgi:hypothetical protein
MLQVPSASASAAAPPASAAASPLATDAHRVGRTAWDYLAESPFSATALVIAVVLVGIFVVFALATFVRAWREGRTFDFLPLRVGPKDASPAAPVVTPAPPSNADDLETALRAALEVALHGHAISVAKTDQEANGHEGALLNTLLAYTTQGREGIRRRASVLEIAEAGAGGGDVMRVRCGSPSELFKHPHQDFVLSTYKRHGKGMCWAAVDACLRLLKMNAKSIDRYVLSVVAVRDEPSYVEVAGHHVFASIMIAPVLYEDASGDVQVLGAVCLDSEVQDHYSDVDGYVLALGAAEICAAWRTRGRTPVAW